MDERKTETREEKRRRRRSRGALLKRFLRGSKRYFAVCILFGLLLTLFDMVTPQIVRLAVDAVIGEDTGELSPALAALLKWMGGAGALGEKIWPAALLTVGAGLSAALCRYLSRVFGARAGETLVKTMRDELYDHIQRLPWSWHMENATGDIIQRCTSDVDAIRNFLQQNFVALFNTAALITMAVWCMAAMDATLSLVAVAFIPLVVTYSVVFHNRSSKHFLECDENEGVLSTIAQENLTGVRVVRAFGRESYERDRFEAQNQVYTNAWMKLCRMLALFWAAGDLSSGLQNMIMLLLCTVRCVNGDFTTGEFVAFLSYNAMLVWPVRQLGRIISQMSRAGVSMDRLSYVLDSEPEEDDPEAVEAPMTGDIVFEDVSFGYGEGDEVLSHVSFTIPAGSSFGILGATGSGKSSLLHLLCRLYRPSSGRITVGGTDIAKMPAAWLRSQIGVVLQEPFLFSRTIGENIGVCGASAEEIRAAAVTACVDGDIRSFPKGYDTLVGERGVTLSGGQKQRVAMARMLSKKTPILVFDDSLSAVDTETDGKIRQALRRDLGERTTILVSHRITTLMDCDNILVLEQGRVAESGSSRELYEKGGIYRWVYDMQMSLGMGEEEEV